MSIEMLEQGLSIALHDDAAANLVDIHAAAVATSAQILRKLGNPRAAQFAALARDLRLWAAGLREQAPETGPRLRLVE
jgi:hypothetical protein